MWVKVSAVDCRGIDELALLLLGNKLNKKQFSPKVCYITT